MKNNKGFVVSAVLYPLLILFLSLMMGLIAMSSTRKNILDNMKMEISDSIFDSVTCDCELINNTLKKYSQEFTNIDGDITSINEAINKIKEEITNIKKDYATTETTDLLESKVNFLTNQLSELTNRVEIIEDTLSKITYHDPVLNGADPVLKGNLIPVIISDNGTVTRANTATEWYNYEEKRWANAILLKNNSKTYQHGDTIPESNISAYFVWVPRYRYNSAPSSSYQGSESTEGRESRIRQEQDAFLYVHI